jgi:hypothetical protein
MRMNYPYFDLESMSFDDSKKPKRIYKDILAEDIIDKKINMREEIKEAAKKKHWIKIVNTDLFYEKKQKSLLDEIFRLNIDCEVGITLDLPVSAETRLIAKGILNDKDALKNLLNNYKKSNN